MATVRDPVKPEPVAKYETLVETRLAQARGRIRALDLTAAFLGLVIGTMAFGLVMALLDRWFHLSTVFRQIALSVYGVMTLAYLGRVAAWPLFRRVNPYYAALQVEHSLPAAKNSVVNWLDLRQKNLPPAIRGAVSHRAAVDISHADLDEAVSPRQVLWLGAGAVGSFLAFLALALFGPGLGRIFQPFGSSNRTELIVVKPEGGNATVSVGRAVSFEVSVEGRRPDSLRFLFRYEQAVPYEERPMEIGDSSRQWVITIPAYEVKTGFWYKVIGGDAETEEYRVQVRPTPLITGFDVTYHPRPYTRLPEITSDDPNLKGIRGTEMHLVAHTNRKIRYDQSGLVYSDTTKPSIAAEAVPGNPQAMQFKLTLEKDGSYSIRFAADDGESNTDPISYSIKVQPDNPPVVVLTKPEEQLISLPANGVLSVEGSATDDFGITGFALRMQPFKFGSAKEPPLPPKPYRPDKSFRLADGSYPAQLDYKDFVDLSKVRQGNGQPLQAGTTLEYWLEATDNCDFPAPNVGRSRSKFVTITEPAKDQDQLAKEKKLAKENQKKHEDEQDQQLNNQGQGQNEQPQKEGPLQGNEAGNQNKDQKLQDTEKKLQQQFKKEQQANGQNANNGNPQPNQENKGGQGEPKAADKPQPDGKPNKDQQNPADNGQPGGKEQKPNNADQKAKAVENPQPDGKGEKDKQPQAKDGQPGADKAAAKEKENKQGQQKNKDTPAGADKGPPNAKEKNPNEKLAPDDENGPQKGAGQPKDKEQKAKDDNAKKMKEDLNPKPQDKQQEGKKKNEEKARVADPTNIKGGQKGTDKPGQKEDKNGDKGQDQGPADIAKQKPKPEPAKNAGKAGKGDEAKDPGNKPPMDEANPNAAPKNPQNKKPDKGGKPMGNEKQPDKKADDANKDDGGAKEETQPNAQAQQGKKDGNGKQNGPPGAKNDPANLDNKQKDQQPGQGNENKNDQAKKDIDNLAKAMKSGDPKARQEAQKKLEDLSQNAKKEADRKAAADALKKASQGDAGADGKEAQKNKPGDAKAEGKQGGKEGDPGQNQNAKAGDQPGQKKGQSGEAADKKDGNQAGGKPGSKGKGGEDQKGGKNQDSAKGEGGQKPGMPNPNSGANNGGERWNPANPGANPEAEKGSEANPEFLKKAGVLQLEEAKKRLKDLKEKANDEFLKNANVSKEELQDYLKYQEERLRRLETQLKQDDKLRDQKRPGGSLSNLRIRRVQSSDKKEDNLSHANQAGAPPELREANNEFTQSLAKPAKDKK